MALGAPRTGVASPSEASEASDVPAPAEPEVLIEAAWLVRDADNALVRVSTTPPDTPPDTPPEEAAAAAGGGEQLFTARFRYQGDAPASGLRIVLAIPDGLRYVADSATGPGVELSYSVDGGEAFAPAGELRMPVDPDDPEAGMRAAWAEEYSHIRWDLPGTFAPGIAGLVSFRARPPEALRLAGAESGAESGAKPAGETP